MCARVMGVLCVLALVAGCSVTVEREGGSGSAVMADKGTLELTVNVRNAEVYVDGSLYGMVKKADRPQAVVVPPGTHELTLKKFGYLDFSAKIGVEAGAVNTLVVEMKRIPTEVVEMPEEGKKVPTAVEK